MWKPDAPSHARLERSNGGDGVRCSPAVPTRQTKPISFKGYTLNPFQVEAAAAIEAGNNVLLAAPTGAGKTNVALLTVLELVARVRAANNDDFLAQLANHKAVYVAPLKALAQEVVSKFSERLGNLGIQVRELTGDAQLTRREADAAHILVVRHHARRVESRVALPPDLDAPTYERGAAELVLAQRRRLLASHRVRDSRPHTHARHAHAPAHRLPTARA